MVTYDPIGQLQSAWGYTSGGTLIALEKKGYQYDAAQNLSRRTNSTFSTTTFPVNVKNELSGATYDANGNILTDSTERTYVYDDENRLSQLTYGDGFYRITFGYDGLGRLRSQLSYSWNGSAWVHNGTTRYMLASQARHQLVSP